MSAITRYWKAAPACMTGNNQAPQGCSNFKGILKKWFHFVQKMNKQLTPYFASISSAIVASRTRLSWVRLKQHYADFLRYTFYQNIYFGTMSKFICSKLISYDHTKNGLNKVLFSYPELAVQFWWGAGNHHKIRKRLQQRFSKWVPGHHGVPR